MFRGVLAYTLLPAADRSALSTFFNSQKGQFDTTWNFVLGGVNYQNLCFTDDTLRFIETIPTLFSCTLNIRQVQNRAFPTPAVALSYPTLSTGATTQLPYAQIRRFLTSVNDQESGIRYAYAWIGAGLTGLPAQALLGWDLAYPAITDADLSTLETFFKGMNGRWSSFTFTDPDDLSVHTKCRFGSDLFEVRHLGPNQNAVSLTVTETN